MVKTCIKCGGAFKVRGKVRKATAKYCSRACKGMGHSAELKGENHLRWQGGLVITKQGYIREWVPDNYPFVSMRPKGTNHILQHRLVMAEALGRPLKDTEQVHHRNNIKDDNRIENLELRTGSHGNGGTNHCLTCTCA